MHKCFSIHPHNSADHRKEMRPFHLHTLAVVVYQVMAFHGIPVVAFDENSKGRLWNQHRRCLNLLVPAMDRDCTIAESRLASDYHPHPERPLAAVAAVVVASTDTAAVVAARVPYSMTAHCLKDSSTVDLESSLHYPFLTLTLAWQAHYTASNWNVGFGLPAPLSV